MARLSMAKENWRGWLAHPQKSVLYSLSSLKNTLFQVSRISLQHIAKASPEQFEKFEKTF
jgi:hypothetical protein